MEGLCLTCDPPFARSSLERRRVAASYGRKPHFSNIKTITTHKVSLPCRTKAPAVRDRDFGTLRNEMKLGLQIPSFTWPGGTAAIGPTLGEIVRKA